MAGFIRSSLIIGAAEVVCRVPLVFTVGYLARALGPEAYGGWALIQVFQGLLAAVAGLGLSSSLSRLASVAGYAKARGYLLLALRWCGGLLAFSIPCAFILEQWLAKLLGVSAPFAGLLPLGVAVAAASVVDGLLDAFFKSQEAVSRQISFILARTTAEIAAVMAVFLVGLAAGWPGERLLALYMVGLVATKLCLYLPIALPGRAGRGQRPTPAESRSFLVYGLPMVPTALVVWFVGQGDRLILGQFLDKHAVGVYAFGASLASYLVFLGYAVNALFLTRASRLHDHGEFLVLERLVATSQQILLVLFVPALWCLALLADEVIAFTGGREFEGAADILLILGVGVAVERILGLYQYFFHLVRRPQWILWLNVVYASLLGAAVYAAALLERSLAEIAIALVAAGLLFNLVRYLASQRMLRMPLRPAVGLSLLGCFGLPWLAHIYLSGFPLAWRLTGAVAACLASAGLLASLWRRREITVGAAPSH